jgi:hypothetical protein
LLTTKGGDIFVLHRGNSHASARSNRTSSTSARRSFAPDGVPWLTTTLVDEENSIPVYEASSSPIVVVTSPADPPRVSITYPDSASRKSDEELDITDLDQASPPSGLDPSSIPLRVVYSPAVSRSPSVSHGSHRASHSDLPSESTESILLPSHLSVASLSLEAPRLSDGQILRRRSSMTSGDNSRNSHQPQERPHTREDPSQHEQQAEDVSTHEVFKVIRERKWLRETIVAKVSLAIVTCCVLGNLIYT